MKQTFPSTKVINSSFDYICTQLRTFVIRLFSNQSTLESFTNVNQITSQLNYFYILF